MKKQFLTASLLLSIILLTGAGCASGDETTTPQPTNGGSTPTTGDTAPTTTDTSTPTTAAGDFNVTVEPVASGTVKISWTLPSDFDTKNNVIRLIHSTREDQDVGEGAYYYDIRANRTEYTWKIDQTGRRYFRICELNPQKQCVRTSETIAVDVPKQ